MPYSQRKEGVEGAFSKWWYVHIITVNLVEALIQTIGVFIKLGQHMSSLIMLPREWTTTMRPLQDQCEATPYEDVDALFLSDMGSSLSDIFDDFDPNPIGVASLAQVHVGHHRASNKQVAVKVRRPTLHPGHHSSRPASTSSSSRVLSGGHGDGRSYSWSV